MTSTNPPAASATTAPQPANPGFTPQSPVAVGGVILAAEPICYNKCRATVRLKVRNTGDRPIQVGSHFHFFEVNRYMEFDRPAAFGMHLNIPATTAMRFEPGDEKEVEVVGYGGKRRIWGFNGLTDGYAGTQDTPSYFPVKAEALRRMVQRAFKSVGAADTECATPQAK